MIVAQGRQHRGLGGGHRGAGRPLGQGRRGPAGLQPQADLQREDRRLDAVDVLVQRPPEGDRAEEGGYRAIGGLGAATIPGPAGFDLAGQLLAVVRLEVVEGPFDDDPAEFAERLLQAGLEAVAGLGRGVGPAEVDDEATEFGDHRDQAGGQREQGGGEVRCREESGARSMVHRGGLSCCGDRACQTLSLHRRGPSTFKRSSARGGRLGPGHGRKPGERG